MLSKFLNMAAKCPPCPLLKQKYKLAVTPNPPVRVMSHLIPPSQYDMPWPKRMNLLYVVVNYWETIPLFVCTTFALTILFYSIYNACANKSDVVFSSHSRESNSRTMDLRNPRVLKIFVINQRYEPWPEMQNSLDKMRTAERRALNRQESCPPNPP